MSSNHLLSSIFTPNSTLNRSSSLMMKTFLHQPEPQSRTRSQSINHHPQTSNNTKYLPLLRMSHIIATKVKKHNYFFFCRLEDKIKKNKQMKGEKKVENEQKDGQNVRKKSLNEGLKKLQEFMALKQSKQNLQSYMGKIKSCANKKSKLQQFTNRIQKINQQIKRQAFEILQQNEKTSLKLQIFSSVLQNHFHSILSSSWNRLKVLTKKNKLVEEKPIMLNPILEESSCTEEEVRTPQKKQKKYCLFSGGKEKSTFKKKSRNQNVKSATKTILKNFQSDERDESQSEFSWFSKDTNYLKKQIRIQAPRQKIAMGKAANIMKNLHEDNEMISLPKQLHDCKMAKKTHLHTDCLREQIPDLCNYLVKLGDNIGVFSFSEEFCSYISEMTDNERPINTNRTFREEHEISSDILKNHKQKVNEEITDCLEISEERLQNKKSTILQLRKKASSTYIAKKNNFVDPSTLKIQDMIRQIEKIKEKEKAKLPTAKNQYKFSVVIPRKTGNKTFQTATKKDGKDYDFQSQKKERSRSKVRQFGKQNTEKKHSKYETDYKKKKVSELSTIQQSLANTCRKNRKKQSRIDTYLNHIKSRSKLSNLKIVRNPL